MSPNTDRYSRSFRRWLWIAIIAVFVVVHSPKDKVEIICRFGVNLISENGQWIKGLVGDQDLSDWELPKLVARLKEIVFFISLMFLLIPLVDGLKRRAFLWDPQKAKTRFLKSGLVFLVLSVLAFPLKLTGYGGNYAWMSLSPFEINSGWLYRRLLMPALAHVFGFQGNFLFHVFSLVLVFGLIYLVIAYFEYEGVKVNFINLLSITTCSFVMVNFMGQGFPDPLMFMMFLLAILASETHESRLAIVALSLATHEASLFILGPLILFYFPKKDAPRYLMVIAAYLSLFLMSSLINSGDFVKTYVVMDEKTALDWVMAYPVRVLGGWLASYKLLWVVILYGLLVMFRSKEWRRGLFVLSVGVISPLAINLITYDVSRHVGWGSLALLMSYSYLLKRGEATKPLLRSILFMNLLIPSIFVGTNAGFRPAAGLYGWLYKISGLPNLLSRF